MILICCVFFAFFLFGAIVGRYKYRYYLFFFCRSRFFFLDFATCALIHLCFFTGGGKGTRGHWGGRSRTGRTPKRAPVAALCPNPNRQRRPAAAPTSPLPPPRQAYRRPAHMRQDSSGPARSQVLISIVSVLVGAMQSTAVQQQAFILMTNTFAYCTTNAIFSPQICVFPRNTTARR